MSVAATQIKLKPMDCRVDKYSSMSESLERLVAKLKACSPVMNTGLPVNVFTR
jgi:hypothetical protein